MKYTHVKPEGTLGQTRDFDEAPILSPNKGKWLPDNPPSYNPATHTRVLGVQSMNNAEIVYIVSPRTPEDLAAEAAAIARQNATQRIAEIRLELVDKIADNFVGTPAEKAQALAAIGTLRAALMNEKSKL